MSKKIPEALSYRLDYVINFFNEAQVTYDNARDDVSYFDKLEQDLLHDLENESINYHDIAKIGVKLKELREQRRYAKNVVELYQGLITLMNDGQFKFIKGKLRGLVANSRGIEKDMPLRKYKYRVKREVE